MATQELTATMLQVPSMQDSGSNRSSTSAQERPSSASQAPPPTSQATKPSSMTLPAKSKTSSFRRMRRIIAEDPEWSLAIVPLLTELCIQHIVQNFHSESGPAGRPGAHRHGDGW